MTTFRRTTRPCALWPPARSCGRGFSDAPCCETLLLALSARGYLAVSWRSDQMSPNTLDSHDNRTDIDPEKIFFIC